MSVKDYLLNYYKIDELLKLLNLSSKIINREVNTLSFSEKVRIEIAFAIIKDYDNILLRLKVYLANTTAAPLLQDMAPQHV